MLRIQDQEVPASGAENVRDARRAEFDDERAEQRFATPERRLERAQTLWPSAGRWRRRVAAARIVEAAQLESLERSVLR